MARKKRLRTAPEILPEPTPPPADGGPRRRTLANMQRLLALAATGAALQAGCERDYGPGDPPPPPPSRCSVASGIKATAAWKRGSDGLVLQIKLARPERTDVHYVEAERERPTIPLPATMENVVLQDGAMTLEVRLRGEVREFTWAEVPVECSAGRAHLAVDLGRAVQLVGPKPGEAVPVELQDAF
jgi:hypothetical protein